MATAIFRDTDVIVGGDGFYNEKMARERGAPRIYDFRFMLGDNEDSISVVAESEEDALRLFYEIAAPAKPILEGKSSSGVCHFVSPGLLEHYRRALGQDVIDRYNAFKTAQVQKKAQDKAIESLKKKTAKEKQKEQERKHSENVLTQVLDYIKRVGAFKMEKEVIQEKDFKEWMDKKDK